MFDHNNIMREVLDYLDSYAEDFDLDGIMNDLWKIEPDIQSIDDMDNGDFIEILYRNDLTGNHVIM